MSERRVPIVCERCGDDMWAETITDGDTRLSILKCINPECDNPGISEVRHRERVDAFVCGPETRGQQHIGYIWAPAP